jgi:hypothetical protein
MRARISAEGFGAQADTYPDGTLTLSIIDTHGRQICQGVWHEPEPVAEVESQQQQWPPQRQSA